MPFSLVVDLSEVDGSVSDAPFLWVKPVDSDGRKVTIATAESAVNPYRERFTIADLPVDGDGKPVIELFSESDAVQPEHFGYLLSIGKATSGAATINFVVPAQPTGETHRLAEFVDNTTSDIPFNPTDQQALAAVTIGLAAEIVARQNGDTANQSYATARAVAMSIALGG